MSSDGGNAQACAFCTIAHGEDSSVEVVCQDEDWVAFFPLHPATPGHTLVIPRTHVSGLWEAEPALGVALMTAAMQVGRAIGSALSPQGMNLITSAGSVAEQTIFHLHLHIVPRWNDDGFGAIWPTGNTYSDSKLENVASRIRKACLDLT